MLVFAVHGMHCGSCGLLVDDVVEELDGVVRVRTSVQAGSTEVVLTAEADREQVAREVVIAISSVGYRGSLRP